MRSRRKFLLTSAPVALGGCLGRSREQAYFIVDAQTEERENGPLKPSVSVVNQKISAKSTAELSISLYNQSFKRIDFTTGPSVSTWLGSPYSEKEELALTDSDNVVRDSKGDSGPCWREATSSLDAKRQFAVDGVWPLQTVKKQYSLASKYNSDCISAGTYRFVSNYSIVGNQKSQKWVFEIDILED